MFAKSEGGKGVPIENDNAEAHGMGSYHPILRANSIFFIPITQSWPSTLLLFSDNREPCNPFNNTV